MGHTSRKSLLMLRSLKRKHLTTLMKTKCWRLVYFWLKKLYEFGHFLLFLAELFITLRGNKKG